MSTVYKEYVEFLGKNKWYAHADADDTGELAYHALGIAGEGGEYVDLVKKIVRDHGYDCNIQDLSFDLRCRMVDELGDVLWYFVQTCEMLGAPLEEVMRLNMAKLKERDAQGGRQHVR